MNEKVLYLIPTVLAADTQFSVLPREIEETIKKLDVFIVENIRTSRRFISSLKLGIEIESLEFQVLDKNSSYPTIFEFLKEQKKSVGVISEAGCPAIADPGTSAVKAAHQLNWKVKPLVGPNSMTLGLMASGFSGQSFCFTGYLPIEKIKQENALKEIAKKVETSGQSHIFMETPYRNQQLLMTSISILPPHLGLCVACDLTSENELIISKSIKDWKTTHLPNLNKRPTVFIIGQF